MPKIIILYPSADISTLLETSSSSVASYEASSTESVGDLSLGEDFLSPRITSSRGATSSFFIQTAGNGFMQMGDGHNLIIIIIHDNDAQLLAVFL